MIPWGKKARRTQGGPILLAAPSLAFDLPQVLGLSWEILLAVAILAAGAEIFRRGSVKQRDRQRRCLDATHLAAAQSLAATDSESALRPIAVALPSLLGATNAQILLVDSAEQQMVYVVGATGRPRGALSMSSISGPVTCFRAKETTEVPDAENCPFISKEWVVKRRLKSALYVPILSGDACIGVIEIEDSTRKRRFDEEQLSAVEHLARIAELSLRLCDQRTMTEQLHRSEKLASVSELASAMAIELREPFAEAERLLTEKKLSSGERLLKVTEQINRAREALERLVRFATPSSSEQKEVNLNALVKRVAADHKKADDGRGAIKLNLNDRSPQVVADPAHLEQVFQILFRHARHFVKRIEGHSLQVHTTVRDKTAIVSIAPLASAEHPMRKSLAQLPDEELTATLGFSICQALIERAGGSLHMDPASSLGFRIDLEYPLIRAAKQESNNEDGSMRRTPSGIRSGPTTALVVEPDESLRRMLVLQLAEQGVRAIPVAAEAEARAVCRRMQFDWVFCELSLPRGSGVELYEAVRNGVEKFIFIADAAALAANPEAFEAPDKDVLRKPLRVENVEALIEELQAGAVLYDA